MGRLLILLGSVLLASCQAATGPTEPSGGRVRDLAEILEAPSEARLAQRLDEAERLYGPQVGIVTVKSLDGQPIGMFATDYANKWGLGDKARDDGLLILIAPNEKQVRIATGVGLERDYPDSWCRQVIDETMLPQFRQGNYARGLAGAVDMIVARMQRYPTRPANDNQAAPAAAKAA